MGYSYHPLNVVCACKIQCDKQMQNFAVINLLLTLFGQLKSVVARHRNRSALHYLLFSLTLNEPLHNIKDSISMENL